jgi:hypothetical protein
MESVRICSIRYKIVFGSFLILLPLLGVVVGLEGGGVGGVGAGLVEGNGRA